jgi:hypothetical protein
MVDTINTLYEASEQQGRTLTAFLCCREIKIIKPGRLWGLTLGLGRQRIGDRSQYEAGDDLDNEVPDHEGIS